MSEVRKKRAWKVRCLFTPGYRVGAVKLVLDTGCPIARVARELGLGEQLLGRWVRAEEDHKNPAVQASDGPVGVDERAELARLRQRVLELEKDAEFVG